MVFKLGVIVLMTFILSQVLGEDLSSQISPEHSRIYGPGLSPDRVRLPCQYFFVSIKDHLNER